MVTLSLLVGVGEAGFDYPFCTTGVPKANFKADESVEVIYAQAPLFSSNPSIGDKGKYLDLYHTCIILSQGAGASRRYWTLEFDFTGGSILSSIAPKFELNISAPGGLNMIWHNDARFCLTEGILWGEKHWSKRFDVVFTISAEQATQTFDKFVADVNNTEVDTQPQYQLWRVAKKWPDQEMLIQDITCADGAIWFLHHLVSVHNAIPPPDFEVRGTATILNAESVTPVNMNDWKAVDKMALYFKTMGDMISSNNRSIVRRLLDAVMLVHDEKKYVYDPNMKIYYELTGNKAPWVSFEYSHYALMGPPWVKPNKTATALIV